MGLDTRVFRFAAAFLARLTEFLRVPAKIRVCPPDFTMYRARFMAGSLVVFSIFRAPPSLKCPSLCRSTPSLRVTGLHSVVMEMAFSHSAASSAFFIVALKTRSWASGFTWMRRARTTSSVGPLSVSLRRCTSSATTREISFTQRDLCLSNESAFSLVVTIMSNFSSHGSLLS